MMDNRIITAVAMVGWWFVAQFHIYNEVDFGHPGLRAASAEYDPAGTAARTVSMSGSGVIATYADRTMRAFTADRVLYWRWYRLFPLSR